MPAEEYAWFMQQDVRRRAILGVDYYEWNEKLIDSNGHAQALGELFGWYAIAGQYYRALPPADDAHRDQPHGRPRRAALALAAVAQRAAHPPDRRAGRGLHLVLAHRSGRLGHRAAGAARQRQSGRPVRSQPRSANGRPRLPAPRAPLRSRSRRGPIHRGGAGRSRRKSQHGKRGGSMLRMLQAHGLDAGPTQRPLLAGAIAGVLGSGPGPGGPRRLSVPRRTCPGNRHVRRALPVSPMPA